MLKMENVKWMMEDVMKISNFTQLIKIMIVMKMPETVSARSHEITADFLKEVDKHLLDIVEERTTEMFEIRDFADILHIHPRHLTDTIKSVTGNSPCYYFEGKILKIAKEMLEKNDHSIAAIAISLTYDPSNFTKFFKRFTGQTPKRYREEFLALQRELSLS